MHDLNILAKDPGCTIPGYLCQVHHNDPCATHPVTDINSLTLTPHPEKLLQDDDEESAP